MNYGRYFVLDYDASDFTHGIAVFNYRGVKYSKNKYISHDHQDSSNDTPKYPFYISLSSEGIFFHIHYAYNIKDESGSLVLHMNNLILSLSVSGNDYKNKLTDIINNCYDVVFPANVEINLIYNLVAERANNSEAEFKGITYSSLEVFDINYSKPMEDRPPIVGFARKLFLDFLFDAEHSKVFQNSIHFNEIYLKLCDNFLFNSIKNKAEYYYRRKLATGEPNKDKHPFDRAQEEILEAEYYSLAEERWINSITSPEAERALRNSHWFANLEEEMGRIFISGPLMNTNNKSNSSIPDFKRRRTDSCNDFISKIEYEKGNLKVNKINESNYRKIKSRVIDSAQQASSWYLRKYSFSGITKIWYGKNYVWSNIIVILSLLLVILGILFSNTAEKTFGDQVRTQLYTLASIPVLWFIVSLSGKRRFIKRIGGINALMPRLFASIVAAWFTLAIGEDIFKGFFDSKLGINTSIVLTVVLAIFVFYEITKINPSISRFKKVKRSLMLLLIAFVYSYTAGLFIVDFFGAQYLERSDYISEFYTNNIYREVPLYKMENKEKFTHNNFYKTIKEHDKDILHQIDSLIQSSQSNDTCFLKTLLGKAFQCEIDNNLIYKTYSFNDDSATYKIPYGLTLILVDAFNKEGTDYIKNIYTKVIEGSVIKDRLNNVRNMLDSIKKHNSSRTELICFHTNDKDQIENAWINLLKTIDNNTVYRETLKELKDGNDRVLEKTTSNFLVFKNLLLQFTFFAMFIGIFLQLIFEDKTVTEPV